MWKRLDPKIATSEKHTKFGFSPLTLWVMMLPHTDSKGRYWANASFIKGQCLPLFEHVRLEQVDRALLDLQEIKLIHLYDTEDGKRYLVYHDVEDFNPPGALRYTKPQWPAPPDELCKCLQQRRESGALAPLVTSPSSSTSSSEGVQGETVLPDSPESRIVRLLIKAKVIYASERQLRTHVGGWIEDKGFQFVEALGMNPAIRGKDVFWIHETYFKAPKTGKGASQPKRKVANQDCQNCDGSGRRKNPVTGLEMSCACVREVAV